MKSIKRVKNKVLSGILGVMAAVLTISPTAGAMEHDPAPLNPVEERLLGALPSGLREEVRGQVHYIAGQIGTLSEDELENITGTYEFDMPAGEGKEPAHVIFDFDNMELLIREISSGAELCNNTHNFMFSMLGGIDNNPVASAVCELLDGADLDVSQVVKEERYSFCIGGEVTVTLRSLDGVVLGTKKMTSGFLKLFYKLAWLGGFDLDPIVVGKQFLFFMYKKAQVSSIRT